MDLGRIIITKVDRFDSLGGIIGVNPIRGILG
jgi:hypothetical protein